MLSALRQLLGQSVIYGFGSVAGSMVSFLLIPLYTHHLSPAAYGELEAILATYQIGLILFAWGMASSLYGTYYGRCQDEEERRTLVTTAILMVLVVAGAMAALGYGVAPQLSAWLPDLDVHHLRIVIGLAALGAVGLLPLSILRARQKPQLFVALTLTQLLLTVGLNLYHVGHQGMGVDGVLRSMAIVQGGLALVTLGGVFWKYPLRFSPGLAWTLLSWGGLHLPNSVAAWIIQLTDRYFLLWFTTATQVGVYTLGSKLGMMVMVGLATPFSLAWPAYMYALAEKDPEGAPPIYAAALTYLMLAACIAFLGLSLFAPEIIRLIATDSYQGAGEVIPLLVLASVLATAHPVFLTGVNLARRFGFYLLFTGVGAGINVGLNWLLIPRLGAMGAALAKVASYAAVATVTYAIAQRLHPIPYDWGRLGKLALACLGIYIAGHLAAMTGAWSFPLRVLAFMAFPLALLGLGFFTAPEIRHFKRLLKRILPGRAPAT
ncbi:Polysaccharide biosynthesis protein [compost metagenome]